MNSATGRSADGERYLYIKQSVSHFKVFCKVNAITSSPTRHPKYPRLAFVCVFILSTMPTSCDISISPHIIENMSTLELVGTNYNAPSQGLLLHSSSKGGLHAPLKAVGPLEFI